MEFFVRIVFNVRVIIKQNQLTLTLYLLQWGKQTINIHIWFCSFRLVNLFNDI